MVVAVALLGIVIVVSLMASLLLRVRRTQQEVLPTTVAVLQAPSDARSGFASAGSESDEPILLSDGTSFKPTPWNGVSRFTVLVMGLDRRPGETGLAYRTDTLMLASIDPQSNGIGILSIPRDLYVEVPGIQYLQRVNTPWCWESCSSPVTARASPCRPWNTTWACASTITSPSTLTVLCA